MEKRLQVDVICTDFSKTFDKSRTSTEGNASRMILDAFPSMLVMLPTLSSN